MPRPFLLIVAAACLVLFAPGVAPAASSTHPGSISTTRIDVSADEVRVELRAQAQTLLETLALDTDEDGRLTLAEVRNGRAALGPYVTERLRVVARATAGEQVVQLALGDVEALNPGAEIPEWFRLELRGPLDALPDQLAVESRLFLEQNPRHVDYASVAWEGEAATEFVFGNGVHRSEFAPRGGGRSGVLVSFASLGVEHILTGWDHLAFVLALLVAVRGVRALVAVVTAFTAAHSVTLALAASGVVQLPSHLVELAIALSIAYVALDNLLRRTAHTPWQQAFGFGLLHGLGFAGFLSAALAGEPLKVSALLGFNLGVEAGQLLVVGPLAVVLLLFTRKPEPEDERWLAPRWLRLVTNIAVAVLGLFLFVERAGWLG